VEATELLYRDRIVEHFELLSHHALRGEIWDKAVSYSYQAGAKAASKSAHREAATKFTAALSALERLPRSGETMAQAFDLRFNLRTSLSPLGEFQRSLELLSEAEAIATTLNDQARLGRVFSFKALHFWSIGQPNHALDASQQALIVGRQAKDAPIRVLATLFAGRARHARGDYGQAIGLMDWVIKATDGDRTDFLGMANLPSVSARVWLSWSLAERGEFAQALVRGNEAVGIAEFANHMVSRIYGYMAVGIVQLRQGSIDGAIETLERAYQMSERADLNMARTMVAGYLGRAYTLQGGASKAVELLERAVEAAGEMGLMVDQAMRLVHLGEALLRRDEVERAMEVARQALQNAVSHQQKGSQAWAEWLVGEIWTRRSQHGHATQHYESAMALALKLKMKPLVAACQSGLSALSSSRSFGD
jgi:tetratricopeptide (TPR) repeat protein